MSDTQLDEFSKDDLVRIVKRNQFVKEQMSQRITALVGENLELLAIVQEQQTDLAALRERESVFSAHLGNGEVPTPPATADVTS
jgi:hypothetical protein